MIFLVYPECTLSILQYTEDYMKLRSARGNSTQKAGDEPITSSMVNPVLVTLLQKSGMDLTEICDAVGLQNFSTKDPDMRITLRQCLDLWQLAVDRTNNPSLGLDLFSHYADSQMHFVTHIVMLCSNLRAALRHWARFARLVCETDRFEFREGKKSGGIHYINTSVAHQNRWMSEHYTVQCYHYIKKFTGKRIKLQEVRYAHADPGYKKKYEDIFQAEVKFKQPDTGLVMDRQYLECELHTANSYIQKYIQERAEQLLEQLEVRSGTAHQVQELLLRLLPEGKTGIDDVADQLFLDRRALQRKLKAEDTSFRDILEETRKTLALHYIKEETRMVEIAHLLGFADASSFQHAFQGWFGSSPGSYRSKIPQ
ncbi:MAG: hypothetical protein CMF59_15245 [Leptospiraceae bacterium]|nr:hypothetical protein [Leptospiraceae bacterium]